MEKHSAWHSDHDVEAIFAAASKLSDPAERAAYLDRVRDPAVRKRVEQLLQAEERAGGFLRDATASPVELQDIPAAGEQPGTVIGPYKLLQVIGEGGMGTVYMADQTHPVSRRVALKVVKPGMDSGEIIARFEAERQALALMEHPNIAKVYDAGATDLGRPYFAMELVRGVPITEYCDDHGLPPRQRLELFVRVCRAVHHAHQKGVIHRDLKPANILVANYDDKAVPKVIDFGIAKAFGHKLTEKTMFTQYGQIIGTFEYMSPEQAKFNQLDVDTRSDIYALGVLVYELLTGATPFDKRRFQVAGFEEVLRIIREEEPPKPSTRISTLGDKTETLSALRGSSPNQLRRALSGELDWIVMRAMDKDRTRRYESAAALADDIERFLKDEAVEACPPSTTYRVKKFVHRHRRVVIAASVVFAVLVLGLIGTTLGLVKATAAEERAESERDAQQRLNFRMAVDRGLVLCDDGHVGHGMLWLARALELCPNDDPAMERVIRANLSAWRRELNTLEALFEHDAPVTSVAMSPRGDQLVAGCYDGTAQLWDVTTGRRTNTLKHRGDVHEVAFSREGTRLLTAEFHSTTAFQWNMKTGDRIHTFEHLERRTPRAIVEMIASGGVLGVAYRHPDDNQVVTSCGSGAVTIWDATTGQFLGALEKHAHVVHDVTVSPDGQYILTSSHANLALLWDFDSREKVATFRHASRVGAADFLPGARIVTGDGNGDVYVWSIEQAIADADKTLDTSKGEYVAGPWAHRGLIHRLRVSPDGKRVLVASFDNTAQLWDPDRNAPAGPAFEHEAQVHSVAWAGDGTRLATGCDDNAARIWRPAASQSVEIVQHEMFDHEAIYTKDCRYVLIKNGETVNVHDALTKKKLCTVQHAGGIRAMAVSTDRSRVMLGCHDRSRLFDTATSELVFEHRQPGGGVWSVAINADGTRTLAGSFDGSVELRNLRTGELTRPALTIVGRAQGVAFSPDGARFGVTGADKRCRVFATQSDGPPVVLIGHRGSGASLSFSGDGRRVASGGVDNAVWVWDVASGKPVSEVIRLPSPIEVGVGTALSSDGRTVVTASSDGTVRIWDVSTSQPIGPTLTQNANSGGVAFTRDGRIQAGSFSGTVHVWDAQRTPLRGDPVRIRIWVEVITGFEMGAEGKRRALDGHEWRTRRARLQELGGPPVAQE